MATVGVEEDTAVLAARILLTLRNRKLLRWPEWVQKEPEPEPAVAEVRWPPERWPKRPRSGGRLRGDWLAALALPKLEPVASAGSNDDERERWALPRRWMEMLTAGPSRDDPLAVRRADPPAHCSALAGSGPSTSTDRKVRPRGAVENAAKAPPAAASVSAPAKEPMEASSPETPLDFGASVAGSGASSSGDDGARSSSKRRAAEALGSGGGAASSSDEGCSSPDKRARVAAGDGDGQKAISELKVQTPDDSKKAVKFEFDLNMPPEDDECPGFY